MKTRTGSIITAVAVAVALCCGLTACESDSDDSYVVVGSIVVASWSQNVTYRPDIPGTYKFTLEGGAYNTGDGWQTALYGYSDRPVEVEVIAGRSHPTNPNMQLGDFTKEPTAAAAAAVGLGSAAEMSINEYGILIVADDLGFFGDNSGTLTLLIERKE